MSPFIKRGNTHIGISFLNSWKVGWPWARIIVDETKIEIGGSIFFANNYVFPAADIARLSIHKGLFQRALRIEHRCNIHPPFVVFWNSDLEALLTAVRRCGYEVKDC